MRTAFAIAALTSSVSAFWGTGHLLVARQAQALLEEEAPEAFQAALNALKPIAKYYPSLVEEENHPFTECATFADDIKGQGYSFQSDWHFINLPYYDEGGDDTDYPDFDMGDVSITDALTDLVGFLKGTVAVEGSTYLEQIADKFSYTDDQESFVLRLIIHYAGDIHQPCHAATLVDSTYPTGDRGGNSEKIPSKDGVSDLHFVFDSVAYKYTGYADLPLSDSDWDWYTSEAASLYEKYPISANTNGLALDDFMTWANESEVLAEQIVYPNFVAGTDPDQDYIDAAIPPMEERLMMGARRLAETIKEIYGNQAHQHLFLH